MSVNGAKPTEWRVFNRCSEPTLRATMDENAFPLTDSVDHRPVCVDGVVLRTPGLPRVCTCVRSSRRVELHPNPRTPPCPRSAMPVGRPGLEIVDFVDACGQACMSSLGHDFDSQRFGGTFRVRITAPVCFEDYWSLPSGECLVFLAMDLRLNCCCAGFGCASA